jgi:hypothetical protein
MLFVIRSILHDIAASCLQTGTSEKMTSFSMIRKKTPFQKHREEEEAKKKVWGRGGGMLIQCIVYPFPLV